MIRILGPANFKQVERAGVWPESPGYRPEGILQSISEKFGRMFNLGHYTYSQLAITPKMADQVWFYFYLVFTMFALFSCKRSSIILRFHIRLVSN